jgi:uncharacterized membrane protein
MKKAYKKIVDLLHDPQFLVKFNGWATVVWLLLLIPSILFLSQSILWLVAMSVWANVAGHWSSYVAARGAEETKLDMDELK